MSSDGSDVVVQNPLLLCDMGDCPAQATVPLEFGQSWLRMCGHHAHMIDPEKEARPQDEVPEEEVGEVAEDEPEQQTA